MTAEDLLQRQVIRGGRTSGKTARALRAFQGHRQEEFRAIIRDMTERVAKDMDERITTECYGIPPQHRPKSGDYVTTKVALSFPFLQKPKKASSVATHALSFAQSRCFDTPIWRDLDLFSEPRIGMMFGRNPPCDMSDETKL